MMGGFLVTKGAVFPIKTLRSYSFFFLFGRSAFPLRAARVACVCAKTKRKLTFFFRQFPSGRTKTLSQINCGLLLRFRARSPTRVPPPPRTARNTPSSLRRGCGYGLTRGQGGKKSRTRHACAHAHMPTPFTTPLLATFVSVLEAVLVCSAGAVLTRYGVLTPAARHALARLGFYVLLPALTFVKVSGCGCGEEDRCNEGKKTVKKRRPT